MRRNDVIHDVATRHARAGSQRMRDNATVMEDVLDHYSFDEHQMVGEETAVTTPPHRLGAHDSPGPLGRQRSQLGHPGCELLGSHMVRVPRGTVHCASRYSASPSVARDDLRVRRAIRSRGRAPAAKRPSLHRRSVGSADCRENDGCRRRPATPESCASVANAAAERVPCPSVRIVCTTTVLPTRRMHDRDDQR